MSAQSDRKGKGVARETSPLLGLYDASTASDDSSLSSDSQSTKNSIYTDPIDDNNAAPKRYGTVDDVESAQRSNDSEPTNGRYSRTLIAQVVGALVIGVFTSNVDGSLVLATHPVISSTFKDLEDSSWLFISFWLAGSATQSLVGRHRFFKSCPNTECFKYGKLCDIYGNKQNLLLSYGLFAIGCGLIGVSQSMWHVILGRVLSGSGQAGMWVVAAVIITDLAPMREVASWQSYLNVVATVGRSLGGPLGGWLADMVGWRWSFLGQVPVFLIAMVLCWLIFSKLEAQRGYSKTDAPPSNLARFDFLGASTLGLGTLALLLPLEIGGQKVPWSHPSVFILLAIGALMLGVFVLAETRWAKEPIFPLRLLKSRDALLGYFIVGCILAAQGGMVFTVPLYFQVSQGSSSTIAGAHLFPAVAGNAIGGIFSGYLIRRTGRYKALAIFASLTSATSYLLMILRWDGNTNWVESMYIFPGGLGCGIIQSAVFIAIQASIDPQHKASGISGFFLATQIGTVIGMAAVSALMIGGLRHTLTARLVAQGIDQRDVTQILKQAVASVDYIHEAKPSVAIAIVASYVDGLEWSHAFSFGSSVLAFFAALLLLERKLDK